MTASFPITGHNVFTGSSVEASSSHVLPKSCLPARLKMTAAMLPVLSETVAMIRYLHISLPESKYRGYERL
ncbi:hypothetical protein HanIR_Chr17g0856731 [Helianthus annuus]|nr:hypothetical protein HanIR_Chr17g0856731 [Helianthus annuus]